MKFYPLASNGTLAFIPALKRADYEKLGLNKVINLNDANQRRQYDKSIKAIATGEFREPQPGEWFLSGAEVEAYRHNGKEALSTKYHIAKLVLTETKTVVSIVNFL